MNCPSHQSKETNFNSFPNTSVPSPVIQKKKMNEQKEKQNPSPFPPPHESTKRTALLAPIPNAMEWHFPLVLWDTKSISCDGKRSTGWEISQKHHLLRSRHRRDFSRQIPTLAT